MLEFITLFVVGIGVGCFGALVGLGGGLIMVPLFMLTMMPPHGSTFQTVQQVIGTSLFGVLLNSVSGTWAYWRSKLIMFRAAVPFAIATIPGAFLGGYLSEYFSGPGFSITFGLTLMALACFMYWKSRAKRPTTPLDEFDPATAKFNLWLGVFLSFFVGFISSILGIGGGIIHVPMMMFVLGFPAIVATATSTFVLMVSAFIGVISHASLGHILWVPAIAVGVGAIVGAQLGVKIAKKSKPKFILKLLCIAMILVGCQLIYRGVA
ncbi:sulfite exporter TauE/SafE family protein [Mesosutterella sp. OilRF-GAM-744-9]|uniref:Probable membrane transporter protein n=1 Tax=Mesosutterella porci TaxID=2915351 RepID=A0ABS9MMJ0_9BURK|nr:sulfite exporter TauE/SafE family protein [Mesosutterella sp. oilRF-744-WT-GAM-9]MCG5029849.1 sulfite exporter TauE/SafE family protein [Mesosutterella sp. oilRF-744-WT-GAM-9]MCI6530672.1 sulfite exporter TauE/SafE family protein [Mesosutterella sp.]